MPILDPNQDLKAFQFGRGTKTSQSSDIDYDYSGQDEAAQKGDELSKLQASKTQALLDNPLSTVGTAGRVRDLRRYLNAFASGTSLPDMPVKPGVRVKGVRESSSNDSDTDITTAYFDPHMRGQNRT